VAQRANTLQRPPVHRTHLAEAHRLVDLYRRDDPLFDTAVIVPALRQLYPEAGAVTKSLQYLLECLDSLAAEARILPGAGVEALEIPHRVRVEGPTSIRGLLKHGGPEDHGVAVTGQAHPKADGVGTLLDRRFEGGNRVLGCRG
jgi:hypothetical protein